MKKIIFAVFLITSSLFIGCSTMFVPSEKDARVGLESICSNNIRVLEFKKVNGQSENHNGVKHYKLFFVAKIQYEQEIVIEALDYQTFDPSNISKVVSSSRIRSLFGVGVHKIGDIQNISGCMRFVKRENGWESLGFE